MSNVLPGGRGLLTRVSSAWRRSVRADVRMAAYGTAALLLLALGLAWLGSAWLGSRWLAAPALLASGWLFSSAKFARD